MNLMNPMKPMFATAALLAVVMLAGCSTAPPTQAKRNALQDQAQSALATLQAEDPSLHNFLSNSAGYAIFPDVAKGGAIVGGAYGRGIVYQHGQPIGYAELNQGSVGAQLGGQSYTELLVFQNDAALGRLKSGNFDVGAQASAVALKSGAAAQARFENGVAVFVKSQSGLMAGATITGQKINFEPLMNGQNGDTYQYQTTSH